MATGSKLPINTSASAEDMANEIFGDGVSVVDATNTGGTFEYVHILFDRHQVVFSEGLATESFLPGPQTTKTFEQEAVKEITTLFPELDPLTGSGYSPSARRGLRAYEADVLFDCTRLN